MTEPRSPRMGSLDAYPPYHRDTIDFAIERNDCECRMCLKARADAEAMLDALDEWFKKNPRRIPSGDGGTDGCA